MYNTFNAVSRIPNDKDGYWLFLRAFTSPRFALQINALSSFTESGGYFMDSTKTWNWFVSALHNANEMICIKWWSPTLLILFVVLINVQNKCFIIKNVVALCLYVSTLWILSGSNIRCESIFFIQLRLFDWFKRRNIDRTTLNVMLMI